MFMNTEGGGNVYDIYLDSFSSLGPMSGCGSERRVLVIMYEHMYEHKVL